MTPRPLRLGKERLAELTTDEMHRVGGAEGPATIKDLCASLDATWCMSFRHCTTAPSCGCEQTWNCQ